MDLLDDRLHAIIGSVQSLRSVVLVDERVLLNCDLSVMPCCHLGHFVFLDLFLSW